MERKIKKFLLFGLFVAFSFSLKGNEEIQFSIITIGPYESGKLCNEGNYEGHLMDSPEIV